MSDVQIEPTKAHPIPYDLSPESPDTLAEKIAVAGNTVELQNALGACFDMTSEDIAREKELLNQVVDSGKASNLKSPTTAFAAAAFLRTYGAQIALDAAQARAAITNKLMEIANCGDTKYELKALELLGKHSDIGLFTERSEITINYKDPKALEDEIKERVRRLLNASVVDTVPHGAALDAELGIFTPEPEPPSLLDELKQEEPGEGTDRD